MLRCTTDPPAKGGREIIREVRKAGISIRFVLRLGCADYLSRND
jgi:hypothetical protein